MAATAQQAGWLEASQSRIGLVLETAPCVPLQLQLNDHPEVPRSKKALGKAMCELPEGMPCCGMPGPRQKLLISSSSICFQPICVLRPSLHHSWAAACGAASIFLLTVCQNPGRMSEGPLYINSGIHTRCAQQGTDSLR